MIINWYMLLADDTTTTVTWPAAIVAICILGGQIYQIIMAILAKKERKESEAKALIARKVLSTKLDETREKMDEAKIKINETKEKVESVHKDMKSVLDNVPVLDNVTPKREPNVF